MEGEGRAVVVVEDPAEDIGRVGAVRVGAVSGSGGIGGRRRRGRGRGAVEQRQSSAQMHRPRATNGGNWLAWERGGPARPGRSRRSSGPQWVQGKLLARMSTLLVLGAVECGPEGPAFSSLRGAAMRCDEPGWIRTDLIPRPRRMEINSNQMRMEIHSLSLSIVLSTDSDGTLRRQTSRSGSDVTSRLKTHFSPASLVAYLRVGAILMCAALLQCDAMHSLPQPPPTFLFSACLLARGPRARKVNSLPGTTKSSPVA